METKGSFNRLEWLLGILLIILLVVVVLLSLLFWFRPKAPGTSQGNPNSGSSAVQNASQIGPTPVFEGQTAKIAYEVANDIAINWQPDAKLLNASATWPQGTPVEDLLTGKITWAFVFYSAVTQKSTTISVVENKATFIGEANLTTTYHPADITSWRLDSNQAIQILLDQGGHNFINQEGITILTVSLTTHDKTPSTQMEWLVSLIGTQSGNSIDLRLNATTGEILELSNVQ